MASNPHFISHQARSALRHLLVSAPRRLRSCRATSFLSSVSSHDRPPRQGLPRPNCHSHRFTSYTLLNCISMLATKILLGQLVKSSMCIDLHGTYHVCIMHMHVYTLTIQYHSMYIKCMYLHVCSCTYTVQTLYIPCINLACTMLPSHEHAMNMNFKM